MSPTLVDLDIFLADPTSPAALDEARKAAESLILTGALVVRDSRAPAAANDRFLDLFEDYFALPDEVLEKDERPELGYQVVSTPASLPDSREPRSRTPKSQSAAATTSVSLSLRAWRRRSVRWTSAGTLLTPSAGKLASMGSQLAQCSSQLLPPHDGAPAVRVQVRLLDCSQRRAPGVQGHLGGACRRVGRPHQAGVSFRLDKELTAASRVSPAWLPSDWGWMR